MKQNNRRTELLDIAERLFREETYTGVSLGDLAQQAGLQKPSIYYHFPGGKEELFIAVQMRMFERVGGELGQILRDHAPALSDQLHAAAEWFLSQPPMFMLSMIHNDMNELTQEGRAALAQASYGLIMSPLVSAVRAARESNLVRDVNPHTVAGAFLAVLESNTIAHRAGFGSGNLRSMVADSVDLILYGTSPGA